MPIMKCQVNGRPGLKWGSSGTCYVGPDAEQKALRQAAAAHASGHIGDKTRKENEYDKGK